ncbi:MAG TPA: glycosyltransferase family 9 protein [Nitrospirae bacterium]|nr:lipopolysaccharide core heptosyltransferase RfaQ [bacterium BMS3Abin06]HDH10819.1 glycosyltransferase family 9 protein [Nitrospirota bacterium]HDZ00937.1 glycosyltransferase family 9 protein [Nitrospirota bacterium]
MNKIKLLKFIDRIMGKFFIFLLPGTKINHKDASKKINRILIIRPGGIGDAVLLLPAINALKRELPDLKIDILSEKRNTGIFGLSENIERIYLYDKGFDFIRSLRNRYDVVIDTEQWHRLSAVAAYLNRAPVRIGFDTNERRRLFTHKIPYSHDDYEVFSFFHLIEPLIHKIPEFDSEEPFLEIPPESTFSLFTVPAEEKERIISIFPGASVDERRWGGDRFGKAARILNDKGYKIVLLGSSAEKADAAAIKQNTYGCIDLTGRTDLRDTALILKMSRLLLTADSGLMHIAYAVGTPTVSLFGAGMEKKWAPRGKHNIVLNKYLSCSPCTKFGYTPPCKRNVECLSSISVNEVVNAIENIPDKPRA